METGAALSCVIVGLVAGLVMGEVGCAAEMGSPDISCTGGLKALGQCYRHWLQGRSLCVRPSCQGGSHPLGLDESGLQCWLGLHLEKVATWPLEQ